MGSCQFTKPEHICRDPDPLPEWSAIIKGTVDCFMDALGMAFEGKLDMELASLIADRLADCCAGGDGYWHVASHVAEPRNYATLLRMMNMSAPSP